ncbi:MAG: gliding motility-associated-like protein [Dokdonia sp.]|jgi:gliding motility-associated-like protein
MTAFAKAECYNIPIHEIEAPLENALKLVPCSPLEVPLNGATNVTVETEIRWEPTAANFGYVITIGTTPGGNEIVPSTGVGAAFFTPPTGLPENTMIYVTIEVRDSSSTTVVCDGQSFTTAPITQAPGCTDLIQPFHMEMDVAVDVLFQWNYAPRATNYILQIGTAPGLSDVFNIDTASNALSLNLPSDLLNGTSYYARVIAENGVGMVTGCQETMFTTVFLDTDAPMCSQLITPADGATGVAFTPLLMWEAVANADGYLITIGTRPDNADVLDNTNLGDVTSTLVLDFDPGIEYFVRITPFNSFGPAMGCAQTSFTTALGCGPYLDPVNGTVVDLNPVIDLEDEYILCTNDIPLSLRYNGEGTEFLWSQLTDTAAVPLSEEREVEIIAGGNYRLDVINDIEIGVNNFLMCESSHEFVVVTSEAATITSVDIRNQGFNFRLEVSIEGSSEYEFAINNPEGPYQDNNVFNNINLTDDTVYVRDKFGCGIVSQRILRDRGFPKYFTPNNDGINDYWQVRGIRVNGEVVTRIQVFDRFGKQMADFNAKSSGWDGTYGGKPLFDGGYWYKAFTTSSVVFTGYFALRK